MDGIEAAEAIRRTVDVPVIYLTAHSDSATLSRAKISEPFGYILKPFEERELATAIEMAIYKHQSERQLRHARNELEQGVRERTQELKELNETLENRIIERTAQLNSANEKLLEINDMLRLEILERKQAEEALRQSEKQLKAMNEDLERQVEHRTRELQETQLQYLHAEKLSAIGKLSASLAHEFNSPLQSVMTIMKGLQMSAVLKEEEKTFLEAAISESKRMKKMLRNLQDFNRPSSGIKVLMDVHETLDSILLVQKSDLQTRRISVALNYAERLSLILVIPDQIKQVLLNLLTNAADACPADGGEITISTWQKDRIVAIAIKDTGVGIEPDKIDRIFQPFYSTKPEVKGTGLGLSISHGIIKNHQGEIWVESLPGNGATFTVLLPVNGT
ncbi:MAG: multi-sensor signal transduction histidine kinase [uncultured bacterium]|nr:MAG: multi-sensor signal transduction histidine kinase [uncultured bacterium]